MKNLILLGALLIPTIVYSANDLERWNSEVGRTVRQTQSDKLAQTTYKEMSSHNVTVSKDMRTVYPQIETNAQVAGSRTRVVAEAVLEVDKDKVWRDWNKKLNKFGKGTAAGVAGSVIVGYILDAVGWVMDEGGKVTVPVDENTCDLNGTCETSKYWGVSGVPITNSASPYQSCQLYAKAWAGSVYGVEYTKLTKLGEKNYSCAIRYYPITACGSCYVNQTKNIGYMGENSAYQKPENTVVSEQEKEQVLKNLLNDPKYADLAAQMIGNTYSMGPENPEPDPNVVNDLKNKQKDVLKSDNPKGDGKTRTDPKIDTGTQGQADTTPKPDTGTGTNPDTGTGTTPTPNPNPNNGSTTNFELPAFCNYAAKLCDWLDWTQEDKELEEAEKEEPEEFDIGTIDKNRFRASGQCPAPIQVNESVRALGKSVDFDLSIEWTQICSVAEDTSPLVLLISTITGLLILVGGGRSSEP